MGESPDDKANLLGTWGRDFAGGYRQLKHITPTHFEWVIYHIKKRKPMGTAGGTWSLQDGAYTERYDYASFRWRQLRGKETTYSSDVEDNRWSIRGKLGTGFLVDETWIFLHE